jgi:hypothetical protein
MIDPKKTKLTCPIYPIPCPDYRQNDYIGWISRAKREETKKRRVDIMLNELKKDDLYMNLPNHSRKP